VGAQRTAPLRRKIRKSWRSGSLACLAEALEGVVVDGELAFFFEAVFEGGAEGVEGGALLGLEELLLDLVVLRGEPPFISVQDRRQSK
jgi:hypothetical protein